MRYFVIDGKDCDPYAKENLAKKIRDAGHIVTFSSEFIDQRRGTRLQLKATKEWMASESVADLYNYLDDEIERSDLVIYLAAGDVYDWGVVGYAIGKGKTVYGLRRVFRDALHIMHRGVFQWFTGQDELYEGIVNHFFSSRSIEIKNAYE